MKMSHITFKKSENKVIIIKKNTVKNNKLLQSTPKILMTITLKNKKMKPITLKPKKNMKNILI